VEGVGGWRVPLGGGRFVGDLPRRLDLPVVLVVGLRLGCLNHALLTAEAIAAEGARLIGWVANRVDPAMAAAEESLATLEALIAAPCLGVVPRLGAPTPARCAAHLDLGVVARH
ncbi:ATP-dependent dethiobiotin synthetase BioD, partial [Thiococcus pfennigii]|uniref:ATP-dependent dethiobiotin synthetase BioD n=1 Tax=Thiococcus pfennigii TaxID=1057 RepID=UPI0019043DF9